MVKCDSCEKILPSTKFNWLNEMRAKGNIVCRDCKNESDREERLLLNKEEAKRMHAILDESGEEFICRKCDKEGKAKDFYYKLDRGYFYINTSQCKECTKERMRYKAFGITKDDFDLMLEAQKNECAICKIDMDEYVKTSQNNKVFSVDHCHSSGVIRGLLCCNCNRGLGYFKDNIETMNSAIEYLQIKR